MRIHIPSVVLTNGHYVEDTHLDTDLPCPPGFIGLRDYEDDIIRYVKVSNIAAFKVAEKDVTNLWYCFDILPETIQVKGV